MHLCKMHLMQKCILASKMHFASHFPKENVQLCKNAVFFALQKTKMCAKMHFCITFCFAEHFPLENVRQNAFLHQMHLMPKCILVHFPKCSAKQNVCIKCICNILLVRCQNAFWRTFSKGKCSAKQNVMQKCIFAQHLCFLQSKKHSIFAQLNIFLWKMWCWTFSKGKCDAEHFTK